jgi:hypothetical protein
MNNKIESAPLLANATEYCLKLTRLALRSESIGAPLA